MIFLLVLLLNKGFEVVVDVKFEPDCLREPIVDGEDVGVDLGFEELKEELDGREVLELLKLELL